MSIKPPSPPVVGDGVPNVHSGRGNKPIRRVVIHSAVTPCAPGWARQLGRINQTSTTGSWHYATDPEETIQCSWDSFVCWHAPPNPHSAGIEMADTPGPRPSAKPGSRTWWNLRKAWRWGNRAHRRMLRRTARLAAHLCLANDLPLVFLSPADLQAGRKGITTHANVSLAFRESSHWDPGWWPRRRFMRLVRREARALRGRK